MSDCFACIYIYTPLACPQRPEKSIGSPGTGYELSCGCKEPNPSALICWAIFPILVGVSKKNYYCAYAHDVSVHDTCVDVCITVFMWRLENNVTDLVLSVHLYVGSDSGVQAYMASTITIEPSH